MLALRNAGYAISVPFGENTRYDLVIEDNAGLARVQCKTGRLRAGAIRTGHHARPNHGRQDYLGQIEYLAVHCPETSGVYLIPISDVQTATSAMLRVEPSRNGQRRRIREASLYSIGCVSVSATRALRASSGARGSCA